MFLWTVLEAVKCLLTRTLVAILLMLGYNLGQAHGPGEIVRELTHWHRTTVRPGADLPY